MEELFGYLLLFLLAIVVVVLVVIYIILPVMAVIAICGIVYGGYVAIANYLAAFNEVTIEGNRP